MIPSEGIGSIPRPAALIEAVKNGAGDIEALQKDAVTDTINKLIEITGGEFPISDGEQTKSSFVTYPLKGLKNLSPNGIVIPFEDGHQRQLPVLTTGPFEYGSYAVDFFQEAKAIAPPETKIKQAVISPSAMFLLYPMAEENAIEGYSREQFIDDVVRCGVKDIRQLLDEGADSVQIDFTEARLALKLDPSGGFLKQLLSINARVIDSFSETERQRIGVHSCPGADHDSTHSADVPYECLIPMLFTLNVGRFYLQMKSEPHPEEVLSLIGKEIRSNQTIFIGVINVNDSRIESPEEVADFIALAAKYIPVNSLGSTDDCGFSPFCDDVSTSREIAFEKIKARIEGTKLASLSLLKK